jgi:hypothetical protein
MERTKRKDQAKEILRAETAAAKGDDEDGAKGKYLLHKLFEDEGGLYKATGHGIGGDCERALFYEINGLGRRSILRSQKQKRVNGYRSIKLGTQSVVISQPICKALRHVTVTLIVFYSQILPCCTGVQYQAL